MADRRYSSQRENIYNRAGARPTYNRKKRKKVNKLKPAMAGLLACSLIGAASYKIIDNHITNSKLNQEGMMVDDQYFERHNNIVKYDDFFTDDYYAQHMDKKDKVYMKLGNGSTRKYVIDKIVEKEYEAFTLEVGVNEAKNSNLFMVKDAKTYINCVPVVEKTMTVKCSTHHAKHTFVTYDQVELEVQKSLKKQINE